MDAKELEIKVDQLKAAIDVLILIELCKAGAKREDARAILGSLSNNTFAQVNKIVNPKNASKS